MIKDVTKFPGVISFIQGDIDYEDLPKSTKEALYEYYVFEDPLMPYGVSKGRTGDPDDWIAQHLISKFSR